LACAIIYTFIDTLFLTRFFFPAGQFSFSLQTLWLHSQVMRCWSESIHADLVVKTGYDTYVCAVNY